MTTYIFNIAGVGKGAYDFYDAHASPHASLQASGEQLEKVRSRLQALSPQRREAIEIASRAETVSNDSPLKSLDDLETELEVCVLLICAFSFSSSCSPGSL